MPADLTRDDLRAATAAGVLTEAQAAHLVALAEARAGRRPAAGDEDEPFEFFRGFAEIFVATGLFVFLAGVGMLLGILGGVALLIAVPAILAGLSWWLAGYFTLKRRMNLPSMVLVAAYAGGVHISALTILAQADLGGRAVLLIASVVTVAAVALWFRRFKLPFAMFVLGLFALVAMVALFSSYRLGVEINTVNGWIDTVTPRTNLRLASLVFGVIAFGGAMWFDLRDPHRVTRLSATAFWLHLLAGAALVNTIAGHFYADGGGNLWATALALAIFALVALVVDRRSILTAGSVYIGALIYWAVADDAGSSARDWAVMLILLGLIFTGLGTWWTALRRAVMRALPDFPGKDRLPPYAE